MELTAARFLEMADAILVTFMRWVSGLYSGINESVDKRVKTRTDKGLGIRQ